MKRVEITWMDITYKDSGWSHRNDVDDFIRDEKENIITQMGYVYLETDTMIVLVDSYCLDERTYGTIHKIPKGCVVSVDELIKKI